MVWGRRAVDDRERRVVSARRLDRALVAGVVGVLAVAGGVGTAHAAPGCAPATVWTSTGGAGGAALHQYSSDGTLLTQVPLDREFTDIAWSVDGTTLYGADYDNLYTVDPATGTSTLFPLTGFAGAIGLSALADGTLIAGRDQTFFSFDLATSTVSTLPFGLESGVRVAGDFLTLPSGDLLVTVLREATSEPLLAVVETAAPYSVTYLGSVPDSWGAAQAGDRLYFAGSDGVVYRLDSPISALSLAASTAVLPATAVSTPPVGGQEFWGAASAQDAGTCLAPVAIDDDMSTTVDTAVTGAPLANDLVPGGADPLLTSSLVLRDPATGATASTVSLAEGTLEVLPDGTVRATPASGFTGSFPPVTYLAESTGGARVAGVLRVSVGGAAAAGSGASPAALAATGSDSMPTALVGVALVTAGAAAVLATRPRRPAPRHRA